MNAQRFVVSAMAGLMSLFALAGCETLDQAVKAGTDIAVAHGAISTNEAQAINRSAEAIGKAAESITPEQEYYIGRAVAAQVLGKYPVLQNDKVAGYINVLGRALAQASERPETFGGYHFQVLDSDEINAFAAPGGLVFISKGMIKLCKREADLAAVLAHEVGHVQGGHGLKAIARDRRVGALLVTGTEVLKQKNPDLGELTDAFSGVIDGVSDVLLVQGYGRKLEDQADLAAVQILKQVGYDPRALVDVLRRLNEATQPGTRDFGKTHPNPATRVKGTQNAIGTYWPVPANDVRRARFAEILAAL
jgi:predicted Zn-dependent protease